MKKRKHLTSLIMAGLVVLALLVGACTTPTPQVIEKEVVVEKEVPVEKEVIKYVEVEVPVVERHEVRVPYPVQANQWEQISYGTAQLPRYGDSTVYAQPRYPVRSLADRTISSYADRTITMPVDRTVTMPTMDRTVTMPRTYTAGTLTSSSNLDYAAPNYSFNQYSTMRDSGLGYARTTGYSGASYSGASYSRPSLSTSNTVLGTSYSSPSSYATGERTHSYSSPSYSNGALSYSSGGLSGGRVFSAGLSPNTSGGLTSNRLAFYSR